MHRNIPYAFNWNIRNHKQKITVPNPYRQQFVELGSYFKAVYKGKIPNNVFNSRANPRISQFKIKGLKSVFMHSLSKKLIRAGRIKSLGPDSKLPKYAQKVFKNFKNDIGKRPGHDPILKNILIKDQDSIAIEIPVWKKYEDTILTGHIDMIQIENNMIKVIDYKPEGRFLMSLPQVATYGFLIKSIFNISDLSCISFNKDGAWEYKPDLLISDIKDYLLTQNVKDRDWEKYLV